MAYGEEGVARKSITNIQEFGTHMFIHKQKTIAMRQAYFTTRAKGQNFLGYVQRRQKNIYIGNAPDLLCICSIAIFHENIYFRGRFGSATSAENFPAAFVDRHAFIRVYSLLSASAFLDQHAFIRVYGISFVFACCYRRAFHGVYCIVYITYTWIKLSNKVMIYY